jgi:hypothetical protein
VPRSSKRTLPSRFSTKILHAFLISPIHATCRPPHPPWFHHPNNICWSVRYAVFSSLLPLYPLIMNFFERRQEYTIFWNEWQQAIPEFNLLLISSGVQFWFFTILPKYVNSDTISKEWLATIRFILSCILVTTNTHIPSLLCVYF